MTDETINRMTPIPRDGYITPAQVAEWLDVPYKELILFCTCNSGCEVRWNTIWSEDEDKGRDFWIAQCDQHFRATHGGKNQTERSHKAEQMRVIAFQSHLDRMMGDVRYRQMWEAWNRMEKRGLLP